MAEKVDIPQQRTDEEVKPNRVITTFVVTLRLDESILRHRWRGKTETDILEHIKAEPQSEQMQEFVDELMATPDGDPKMMFVRHVKIVDPN